MVLGDLRDTLTEIGAIGGLIAIIGTGLLVLLVASQNRQLRQMRDWIDAEPERQQEVTRHVIAEVQRRIAVARQRRTAGAGGSSVAPPAAGVVPPAGVVPASGADVPTKNQPAAPGATPAPAEGPRFAPLTPAAGAAASTGDGDGDDEAHADAGQEPDDDLPAVVAAFEQAGRNQDTVAADALEDREEDELDVPPFAGSAAAARGRDTRYDEDFSFTEPEPRRGTRLWVGLGLLAMLAGIVLLASQLFGGDDPAPQRADDTPAQSEPAEPGAAAGGQTEPVDPSTITVQVFNGTMISGLAQRITERLKSAGYGTGQPETASGASALTATTISYREGFRAAAEQLAERLNLGSGAVQAMDAETAASIGESFEIVVTAGSDLGGSGSTPG